MNRIQHDEAIYRPRVPATLPEATKALEEAWKRRRAELGTWQPSNGWLIEPKKDRP